MTKEKKMSIEIRSMSIEELKQMCDEDNLDRETFKLNKHDIETLENYVNHGLPPGGFLNAVLTNNLKEATGRADLHNRRRLFEYVQWLYNEAPAPCWGSEEKVSAWLARFANEI